MAMEFTGGSQQIADLNARVVRKAVWTPSGEADRVALALGTACSALCAFQPSNGTTVAAFTKTGTGTNVTALVAVDNELVADVAGSGTGNVFFSSIPVVPRLSPASNLGDDITTQIYRWVFRFCRSAAATPAEDFFGLYFHPNSTTSPTSPGTTGVGFGVVGDGAGGWKFIARKVAAGAKTFDQPIVWPVAITRLTDIDVRILPPTATSGARLQVRVGGTLIVNENWDNGKLPFIADGVAASAQYNWSIRNQNIAYPNIQLARITELIYSGQSL